MGKLLGVIGASLFLSSFSITSSAASVRVGDFALIDDAGKIHQLSRYRHKKAVVLLSQAQSCETSEFSGKKVLEEFTQLKNQWEPKEIAFLVMDSSGANMSDQRSGQITPVLLDESQLVAETLSITKVGEVVVLDPENFNLLYRGPVNGSIKTALQDVENNKTAESMIESSKGCNIQFASRNKDKKHTPDYAADIAPIIKENCAECHRAGGIGPFAMDSYMMLKGWSPMIRETLLTKRMPPTQVDPNVGHFNNARYISNKDLQTLVHWIDAGSPKGDIQSDPLVGLEWPDIRDWQLGEPDYIVKAPKHEIPATGVIDYINKDIELTFDEDKWVKAVQFIPGDPGVLHHLLTYVTGPQEDFDGGEGGNNSIARRFLEGYAPGKIDSMTFPEDTGVFIPKGHKLSMQFHYTTNGKATSDETILGLYFHDKPPKFEYLNRSVSGRFKVPPHSIEHKANAEYVFEEDVVVHGLRAHMHFRGRYMRFTAEFPDGTKKDLLNVPNYSYAWQPTYQLDEPVNLPAGTKVHVTGAFDNSEFNPANPDPSKELTFGLQSWDEMFIGYWSYHSAKPAN
ncbi:MAG: hypothetical protein ACRBCS_01315 [Cellvibrionaceae bacterium]